MIKDKILKTEKVEWKNLLPLQGDNIKTLSKENYEKLRTSLLNNSFIDPLNVWETKEGIYILDGHHRIKALFNLEKEGISIPEKLTANFIDCKDRKEAAKVLLLACSDYAKLENEGLYEFISLEELDFEDLKMEADLPEIDFEEFEKCFYTEPEGEEKEGIDDTPEVKEEAISKLGDLFLIDGKHRILCGDSTKEEDVKRLMDGNKADMVFTDPPYNIDYTGYTEKKIKNSI